MPLRLSGLNVDGWFVAGASPEHLGRFMSDGDLAQIASWRFTHLRLPVDEALLDEPAAWVALDGVLDGCARYGLGCVLALRTPQTGLFACEFALATADLALGDTGRALCPMAGRGPVRPAPPP